MRIKGDSLIDVEKLVGYLKMIIDFTGKRYFSYKQLREIIKLYVKGDKDAKN